MVKADKFEPELLRSVLDVAILSNEKTKMEMYAQGVRDGLTMLLKAIDETKDDLYDLVYYEDALKMYTKLNDKLNGVLCYGEEE